MYVFTWSVLLFLSCCSIQQYSYQPTNAFLCSQLGTNRNSAIFGIYNPWFISRWNQPIRERFWRCLLQSGREFINFIFLTIDTLRYICSTSTVYLQDVCVTKHYTTYFDITHVGFILIVIWISCITEQNVVVQLSTMFNFILWYKHIFVLRVSTTQTFHAYMIFKNHYVIYILN